MTKDVLRYLNNAKPYLKHVLAVWSKYFASEQEFRDFFAAISDERDKDLFLRVGSFYRFLVLEGHFHFEDEDWNRGMSYIDDSYKYMEYNRDSASFFIDRETFAV